MAKNNQNDNASATPLEPDENSLGEGEANGGNAGGNGETETPAQPNGNDSGNDDVRAALERANRAIQRLDEYEGTRAGYEKRLTDAQAAIDEFRTELVAWKDQLSAAERKETETRETIATLQTELAALRDSLTTIQSTMPTPIPSLSPDQGSPSQSPQTAGEIHQQAATISSQGSTQNHQNGSDAEGEPAQKSKPQAEAPKRKRVIV